MRLNDRLTGLLLILFGVGTVLQARIFPLSPGQNIGPGLFPTIIGVGFAACGLVLIWSARRQTATGWIEFDPWVRRPRMVLNAAGVIGVVIFYAALVEIMGFFITSFLLLGGLFFLFGVPHRWIPVVAAMVTFVIHFVFYTLLRVPLPWGWLEGFAW